MSAVTRVRPARALLAVALLAAGPAHGAKKEPPPQQPRIVKLARLLELEDRRSTGEGELERLLGDPDRGVRRRAALAAGRVAAPELVPRLVELVNDAEPEVRRMAVFALGLAGSPLAVDRLLAALQDSDGQVRGRAAEALGAIGEPRAALPIAQMVVAALPKTIDRMTVRGDDPNDPAAQWSEQRLALVALARLKQLDAARLVLLDGARPRFDWWAATWVAMRLERPELEAVLLQAARSDEPLQRALAARGLGALGTAAALEPLLALARDRDETTAAYALRALATLNDPRGGTAAAAALDAPSDVVRREALLALARLPGGRGLTERLVQQAASPEPWLRAAALRALFASDREGFALVLSGMDPDPDFRVRGAVAAALGTSRDEADVRLLNGLLSDPDPRGTAAVLGALAAARGKDALETLRAHLAHADLGVRVAAAEAITTLSPAGLSGPLLEAWRRGLEDGSGELEGRMAALVALAAQKDEPARAGLAEVARSDPARAMRARAAQLLRAAGGQAPDVGPELVQRPALDYRALMAPYDPRPEQPLFTPRAFLHTRHGTIELHLDVVEAPLTTASFVALARRGFYDGLTFHRVEPGFVVQGGDPRGDGNGGPGYALRCEITRRAYGRGALGMALSGKDTGGSQFFITLTPQPHLDGGYTRFGQVVSGMEAVDRIRPGDVIERVTVWTGE
jgi:cyclophilin family peptidyl-prolyl cis-trans isomerase/HEAT repeat protein